MDVQGRRRLAQVRRQALRRQVSGAPQQRTTQCHRCRCRWCAGLLLLLLLRWLLNLTAAATAAAAADRDGDCGKVEGLRQQAAQEGALRQWKQGRERSGGGCSARLQT